MPNTRGIHLVKSAYGLWLPGDERGHWSTAWDEHIGYVQPHQLHPGDPVRERMAAERLKHPPVRWSDAMTDTITRTLHRCADESPWNIAALCVEPTHLHLLMTYSTKDANRTAKWLSQEMTKAVHTETAHPGPVFAKGRWLTFVFDDDHWANTLRYINRHTSAIQ